MNGPKAQPLYRFLRLGQPMPEDRDIEKDIDNPATCPSLFSPSDVTWNFEKFLVDRSGKVRHRFIPDTAPEKLVGQIENLL